MSNIKDFCPLWGEWYADESSQIGKGSFGRVYRAIKRDNYGVYESAVKHIQIPLEGTSTDDLINEGIVHSIASLPAHYNDLRDKLINEINICYSLKGNSNIVSFEEHAVVERPYQQGYDIFIRMEYLQSLTDYINHTKCDENTIIKIGLDICEALILLNKRHIIHRDIKPANIFVNKDGTFKLGDFGESKVLSENSVSMSVKGTYHYMAPEVLRCGKVGRTADIYSLGIVMYRLLNNNKYPFIDPRIEVVSADMLEQSDQRRFSGEKLPVPCNCSNANLANIVLKACEYNATDRWQTPQEFKQALLSYINGTYNHKNNNRKSERAVDNLEGDTIGRKGVPPIPPNYAGRNNYADNFAQDLKAVNHMNQYSNNNGNGYQNQQANNSNGNNSKDNNKLLVGIIIALVAVIASIVVVLAVPDLRESVFDALSLSDSSNDDSNNNETENNTEEKSDEEQATASEIAPSQSVAQQEPTVATSTKIIIPSYANKSYEEAKIDLEHLGLIARAEYENSNTVPKNSVIRQDYSAGTTVDAGSTVTLTVSKGPSVCPYDYSQFVQVVGSSNSSSATLTLYNWGDGEWQPQFTCDAKVGKNGIGYDYGEGKSVTPKGLFKLGVVLSAYTPNTSMPYYKVTSNTCVVDDTSSYLYNTICDISSLPSGTDYDPIGKNLTNGTLSECIYIEHNGNGYTSENVVRGKGSVITICGWTGTLDATYGCVDITSSDMKTLLSLLDISKNPQIDITTN